MIHKSCYLLAERGKWYTSHVICLPLVRHTSMFSKELKEWCLLEQSLRWCWKMSAPPPPPPDTGGPGERTLVGVSPASISPVLVRHSASSSLSVRSVMLRAWLTADLAFHTPACGCFWCIFFAADPLQLNFKQKWLAVFMVMVTVNVQSFTECLSVLIFYATNLFATKLGIWW